MSVEANPLVLQTMGTTMLVSLAALYFCWHKHAAGKPLLSYQPRRPVPWGLVAVVFAIVLPSLAVLLLVAVELPPGETIAAADFIYLGWLQGLVKIGYVVICLACLATFLQADSHDLGLPRSWPEMARDIGLGMFACWATLLPIYIVQISLTIALGVQETHPLIEQLQDGYSPQLAGVGLGMAVVVAPLYEEFTFRLLFQGWLEKWEDRLREHLASWHIGHQASDGQAHRTPTAMGTPPASTPDNHDFSPRALQALPPGWPSILVSGLVFGLAHLGHGVAPIPLTLFGIVLGYLYQRTHRLLPCIAAHMTFNAYSMLLLWLQFSSPTVN